MGMFTSIIHPKDGNELQIKTGYDDCDTYKLGDPVKYVIHKDTFGQGGIFDGVYDSYSFERSDDDWVIIKKHKVAAVVPRENNKYKDLIKQYSIHKPDRTLWTNLAYKKHKKMLESCKKENKEFEDSIKHLPPNEKMVRRLTKLISTRMDYEGIARKIFDVQPMPSGAPLFFEDKENAPI